MAVVTVNERFVKLARVDQSMVPAVSGAALDAGTFVSQGADGRYVAGGTTGGIVVETVLTPNAPISVLKKGILDLGADALSTRNPGTPIYGSPSGATVGALDDAASRVEATVTIQHTRIGTVEAGRGDLNGEGNAQRRYLRVEL